jgi:hypothetical protein
MPIEIKELVVKFNVTESNDSHGNESGEKMAAFNYNKLVRDCTTKVIKELKRKTER